MKQTAVQQAIVIVKSRMESMDETFMGKHSAHHLQQVERLLYDLLEDEKYQISIAHIEGAMKMHHKEYISGEQYYNENYGQK
jgi:phosphoribosylformylglycinamidine (FGAM) synthase-like amidotransferase family enzyme